MSLDLKETLTKKYGPFPGYVWVGIGAVGIVVLVKLRGGKSSPSDNGNVTLTPNTSGALPDQGGGGGGGADFGASGDGLGSGFPTQPMPIMEYDYSYVPATVQSAPVGTAPVDTTPTVVHVPVTVVGHNPSIDAQVPPNWTAIATDNVAQSPDASPIHATQAAQEGGIFTAPIQGNATGSGSNTVDPGHENNNDITALVDQTGHVVNSRGSRIGGFMDPGS